MTSGNANQREREIGRLEAGEKDSNSQAATTLFQAVSDGSFRNVSCGDLAVVCSLGAMVLAAVITSPLESGLRKASLVLGEPHCSHSCRALCRHLRRRKVPWDAAPMVVLWTH